MGHPFEGDPERVVVAGDWHGDGLHAGSVIQWAAREGAAGVVQLGDFGVWPGRAGKAYLGQVQRALDAAGLWLAFVDGNHEDHVQLAAARGDGSGARPLAERIWHIPRGYRWEWHGRTWIGVGGATSLDRPARRPYVDWWPEEELTCGDYDRATAGGEVDVMVTHDAPAGYDVPGIPPASVWPPEEIARANQHRGLLRQIVDEVSPQWLFHGHFHSRYSHTLDRDGDLTNIEGLDDNQGPSHANAVLLDPKGMEIVG